MRKWRPSHKSIYVIPEVRGNMDSLEVILNRILPLRIFKSQEDILVMLGNYIDADVYSDKVLDCLINIKEEYKDRVIFLRGSREELMLRACRGSNVDFNYWTETGGFSTIESYVKRNNLNTNAHSIRINRLADIIPKTHIEFLNNLDYYSIFEDYCFFHAGFDINKSISENGTANFVFDYTSSKYVKDCIKAKKTPLFKDNYVFVGNNNYMSNKPFIYSKYFMLGGTAPSKLLVFELNSVSSCAVSRGKSRIYKYNFSVHE